jgi:hypothetical protein
MPGPSDLPRGNIALAMLLQSTLSPASVAQNTTAEQTFTLNGLLVGDIVSVTKPTTQAGLGIVNARVSANNTLAITFANNTAAPIVPTALEVYIIELNRPSNPAPLPTAVV